MDEEEGFVFRKGVSPPTQERRRQINTKCIFAQSISFNGSIFFPTCLSTRCRQKKIKGNFENLARIVHLESKGMSSSSPDPAVVRAHQVPAVGWQSPCGDVGPAAVPAAAPVQDRSRGAPAAAGAGPQHGLHRSVIVQY